MHLCMKWGYIWGWIPYLEYYWPQWSITTLCWETSGKVLTKPVLKDLNNTPWDNRKRIHFISAVARRRPGLARWNRYQHFSWSQYEKMRNKKSTGIQKTLMRNFRMEMRSLKLAPCWWSWNFNELNDHFS